MGEKLSDDSGIDSNLNSVENKIYDVKISGVKKSPIKKQTVISPKIKCVKRDKLNNECLVLSESSDSDLDVPSTKSTTLSTDGKVSPAVKPVDKHLPENGKIKKNECMDLSESDSEKVNM